jgi:hypothetical protein
MATSDDLTHECRLNQAFGCADGHGMGNPPHPSNRRRYTRTRATSLSFSWRGRLGWSAPPILFLLWLMSGPLGAFSPLAWFIGAVTTGFTIWWLRQVWTPIPLPSAPPQISAPTNDHDVVVGSDRVVTACHDESVMIIARGEGGSVTATAAGVPAPTDR